MPDEPGDHFQRDAAVGQQGHEAVPELPSDEAWAWLYDGRIDTRRALLRMEPCTVSVIHASTRITWTIRPVVFLPMAHRQGVDLPACAYDFKPHADC
ncbi:hypothetical protein GCM10023086_21170 [Streptomyces venetus]|uniref:Uncharacterized protein n=1 Tax=Streptomyces venetus TaxID=1701086 RepID=A0ABP8FHU3_9ACTN